MEEYNASNPIFVPTYSAEEIFAQQMAQQMRQLGSVRKQFKDKADGLLSSAKVIRSANAHAERFGIPELYARDFLRATARWSEERFKPKSLNEKILHEAFKSLHG